MSAAARPTTARSRIQMITTLLRKLGLRRASGDRAVPRPSGLLRALARDEGAARHRRRRPRCPHLKRMAASDPHPEPRRAARAVLDRLERPALHGRPPDMARDHPCTEETADRARRPRPGAQRRALRPRRRGELRRRAARCSSGSPTTATSSPTSRSPSSRTAAPARALENRYTSQVIMLHRASEKYLHPRQFLAVAARQRVQGERHLALLLPCRRTTTISRS